MHADTCLQLSCNLYPAPDICDDDSLREHGWVYTSAFFVFSIHNFTPLFAWPTIDGVFFAVAGAWFLVARYRNRTAFVAVAAVLLMASACAKQSFYPMPLIGLGYLCVVRRKLTVVAAYLASCCALLAGFILALKQLGILGSFVSETSGSTHIKDAIQAGALTYIQGGAEFLGYCLILVLLLGLTVPMLPDRLQGLSVVGKRLFIFLGVFFLANVAQIAKNIVHSSHSFVSQGPLGYSQAMFLIAAYFAVEEMRRDFERGTSFLVVLMIAWCASMSWGYQTPLFFSAPLIFGVVRLASRFGEVDFPPQRVALLILCFGLVTFAISDLYPYRDLDGRLHDHDRLGKLTPRLSGIIAGDQEYAKLSEFLTFERRYGDQFVTLPAFTVSHFLTATINPAPVDWALNAEMASKTGEVFSQISSDNLYAIVDIEELKEYAMNPPEYGSDLSLMVEKRWCLVAEGRWYRIYANPRFILAHGGAGMTSGNRSFCPN